MSFAEGMAVLLRENLAELRLIRGHLAEHRDVIAKQNAEQLARIEEQLANMDGEIERAISVLRDAGIEP